MKMYHTTIEFDPADKASAVVALTVHLELWGGERQTIWFDPDEARYLSRELADAAAAAEEL